MANSCVIIIGGGLPASRIETFLEAVEEDGLTDFIGKTGKLQTFNERMLHTYFQRNRKQTDYLELHSDEVSGDPDGVTMFCHKYGLFYRLWTGVDDEGNPAVDSFSHPMRKGIQFANSLDGDIQVPLHELQDALSQGLTLEQLLEDYAWAEEPMPMFYIRK